MVCSSNVDWWTIEWLYCHSQQLFIETFPPIKFLFKMLSLWKPLKLRWSLIFFFFKIFSCAGIWIWFCPSGTSPFRIIFYLWILCVFLFKWMTRWCMTHLRWYWAEYSWKIAVIIFFLHLKLTCHWGGKKKKKHNSNSTKSIRGNLEKLQRNFHNRYTSNAALIMISCHELFLSFASSLTWHSI